MLHARLPDFPAWIEDHDRATDRARESYLRERPPLPADGDHRVSGGRYGQIPGVADAGCHRVVNPLIRCRATLARQDSDRRSASRFGASSRSRHHLAEAPTDDSAPSLGEEASHVFRPLLVLRA